MKRHLLALVTVAVVAALSYWGFHKLFSKPSNSPSYSLLEQYEREGVPNFEAKNLDGTQFELKDYAGKLVILNFWASWCGPCVEEVPSLIKLVKEMKGDVKLIAISGDSNREDIDIFLKSFPELRGEDIQIVFDQDRRFMKMFEVQRLPESLVLGKDHKLVKKIIGTIEWYSPDSLGYMRGLMQK